MRNGNRKWLLGLAVCIVSLVFLSGCAEEEERKTLGEVYGVEAEELTEIYLDGITEGLWFYR